MASTLFSQNQPNQNGSGMNGIQRIKAMMQMVRGSNNPQAAMQSMAANNPQMQQVLQYIQQSGGDPRAAFYKMAAEKGVDPNQIIGMLK